MFPLPVTYYRCEMMVYASGQGVNGLKRTDIDSLSIQEAPATTLYTQSTSTVSVSREAGGTTSVSITTSHSASSSWRAGGSSLQPSYVSYIPECKLVRSLHAYMHYIVEYIAYIRRWALSSMRSRSIDARQRFSALSQTIVLVVEALLYRTKSAQEHPIFLLLFTMALYRRLWKKLNPLENVAVHGIYTSLIL